MAGRWDLVYFREKMSGGDNLGRSRIGTVKSPVETSDGRRNLRSRPGPDSERPAATGNGRQKARSKPEAAGERPAKGGDER